MVINSGSPLIVRGAFGETRVLRAEYPSGFSADKILTLTEADGKVTVIRSSDQPRRTYELSDWLRGGGYSPNVIERDTYRVEDVRVGDVVILRLLHSDLVHNICESIKIMRRPRGIVPPPPAELPSARNKHADWVNALADWEERGIPLPYKYHPGGPWPQLAPPPRVSSRGLPSEAR